MKKKVLALVTVALLAVAMCMCLTACNYSKHYTDALKKEGYTVTSLDAAEVNAALNLLIPGKCEEKDCKWGISAQRELEAGHLDELLRHVSVAEFNSNAAARAVYDSLKRLNLYEVYRNEKMVIWGTKDAVQVVLDSTPFASNT